MTEPVFERPPLGSYSTRMREAWLKKPEALYNSYENLLLQLMFPPEPWKNFGFHVDENAISTGQRLTFWGQGEDGFPLWERVH